MLMPCFFLANHTFTHTPRVQKLLINNFRVKRCTYNYILKMNSLFGVSYYFQINEKSQYTVAPGYAASHKFKKKKAGPQVSV